MSFRDNINAHPRCNRHYCRAYGRSSRCLLRGREEGNSLITGLPLPHGHVCTAVAATALAFQLVPFLWYTCVCYSVFWVWYQLQLKEDENSVRTFLLRHLFFYVVLCFVIPLVSVIVLFRIGALGPSSDNRYLRPPTTSHSYVIQAVASPTRTSGWAFRSSTD